ncbi:rod shape-determining protein MreD [Dysgonomonadaceae bacterium PH5-43]|nr:rod shape-determining protein MreD [Dysgonomonadaceae bacterium PH5-43]
MKVTWLRLLLMFFLLVFLQVWICDRIHILGYATPYIYIYFLIKLPIDTNKNLVLFLSFIMGMVIDLFNYSLGINILASIIAGFSRFYLLKLSTTRDVFESATPGFATFGKSLFLRYASCLVFLHHLVLFTVEAFSAFDLLRIIFSLVGSFILTMTIIFAFESINTEVSKR